MREGRVHPYQPPLTHYRFCLNSNKLPLSEKTKYGRFRDFWWVGVGRREEGSQAWLWTLARARGWQLELNKPFNISCVFTSIWHFIRLSCKQTLVQMTKLMASWDIYGLLHCSALQGWHLNMCISKFSSFDLLQFNNSHFPLKEIKSAHRWREACLQLSRSEIVGE